jgi:hypothetical protein
MKPSLRHRLGFFVILLITGILASTADIAQAHPQRTPRGFDMYIVYMADGFYDPATPHPGRFPGCGNPVPGQCDSEYFQRNIMKRSSEEIAAEEAAAITFFNERFGLDVEDPANADRLLLAPIMVDPRTRYRVRTMAGMQIDDRGWVLQDGGWLLAVIDPDGFDLGGEFEGTHVPTGAFVAFGDYYISVPPQRGSQRDPIIIHYQSDKPIVVNADGTVMFQCQLFSEEFGEGLAQGTSEWFNFEDGFVKMNIRNVLTFPPLGRPSR